MRRLRQRERWLLLLAEEVGEGEEIVERTRQEEGVVAGVAAATTTEDVAM
jgi:hypothetical protein